MKYTKSKKINPYFMKINSQMELPFLETNSEMLKNIFNTLENKFGLLKNSDQKLIDLGSGNGQIVMYSALNYAIKSIGILFFSNTFITPTWAIPLAPPPLRASPILLRANKLINGYLKIYLMIFKLAFVCKLGNIEPDDI